MYYLVLGFFYLLSLLPFSILYLLSDLLTLLVYTVFGYRKAVVMGNLALAFPEKTEAERKKIARQFYKNFIDTLLETVKMTSLGEQAFLNRVTCDASLLYDLASKGKNIQLHGSHQMNWEYINWILAKKCPIPLAGVYMPIANKAVDKVFQRFRGRHGTILISTREFAGRMHSVFKNQYALALGVDQNPGVLHTAYWLNFFTKATPFVKTPDKAAVKNNAAVVFVNLIKGKRGYYHVELTLATENAGELPPGELTLRYRDFLESIIRSNPDNYLWSHRRWKYDYAKMFAKCWIDTNAPLLTRPID